MRIASLLASGTEIVCALGLEDHLVAISHECDYPERVLDRPRVSRPRFEPAGLSSGELDRAVRDAMRQHGSVYQLDTDRLQATRPDLILAQAVCEVCAVPTSLAREAAAALDGRAEVVSLDAHSIMGILESIRAVGGAAGAAAAAHELIASLKDRLARVDAAVADTSRPRVLAIEWLDPPFVPGHWTPEMIALAGGECVVGEPGVPSRQVSWDDLAGLDPDGLLVLPCGYKLDEARADCRAHAAALRAVAPRAFANGDVWVLNGSDYFNRSGPRFVDGVEILAAVLHPESDIAVDLVGKAEKVRSDAL